MIIEIIIAIVLGLIIYNHLSQIVWIIIPTIIGAYIMYYIFSLMYKTMIKLNEWIKEPNNKSFKIITSIGLFWSIILILFSL